MNLQFSIDYIARTSLTIFAVAVVCLLALSFRNPRGQRRAFILPFLFRLLVLLSLSFVLAGPFSEKPSFFGSLPVLIDVSESMDAAQGEQLFSTLKGLSSSELPLSLYPFSKKVSSVPFSINDFSSFTDLTNAFSALDPGTTALSEAIDTITSQQSGAQILLASDGWETRGSIREKLSLLAQKQIKIFPLVPDGGEAGEGVFRISHLYAPLTAAQLTTSTVRVTVENTTSESRSGVLQISQGTNVLSREAIQVGAGASRVIIAQTLPAKGGIEKISAKLIPDETVMEPSAQESFIASEGREKILLLSGSGQDSTYLGKVLENQAYQLESRTGSSPISSDMLSSASAIILNNISLEQLGRSNADALVQAARSGKGLIMVGGDRSFGLGGYRGSVIEDALPVELLPPQREERRLNVAVMLVIDKSRSMDSDNKMDYAKEAARTFIANMKNDDYIGVIAFDASPFIVVRLGLLSEIRAMASDRISRIFPTGSTRPLSAIDEARRSLVRVNAGRKHMLFLTDGQIEDAGPHYTELIRQMRMLGITSSTVMLGGEADGGFLKTLAQQGGGSYYQTNDARSLPRIFLNDVRVASGEQTMREQKDYRVLGAGPISSTEIDTFPAVSGYVQTKAKSKAQLELVVSDGEKQEPLLARWKYGQGNVIAFTSDANGRWSRDWISWSRYHQFWNDILNSVRPPSEAGGEKIPFDMRHFVENSKLVVEYALYDDSVSGDFSARMKGPDGNERDVSFTRVSPGRYRAEIADPLPGRYDLSGSIGNKKTAPVAISLSGEGFKEQKGMGFNNSLLQLIARSTSASINPSTGVLLRGLSKNTVREDRSSIFVALAILFALLEILCREVLARRGRRLTPATLLLCVMVSCVVDAHASPQSEYYITQALGRYFPLPVDARTLSTSGSDSLMCRGSVCNYVNPAGLGFTKKNEIGLTFASRDIDGDEFLTEDHIEQSEDRGFIAGAIPLGEIHGEAPRYGTLGLAFSRYRGETNDSINTAPDGHRRTLAYGYAPTDSFSLGYSFTFYDDQLKSDLADLHSHARFLHLFGFQHEMGDGLSLGGMFQLGIGQSDTEDFNFRSDGLSHLRGYTSNIALRKKWEMVSLSVGADYNDLSSEGNLNAVSDPVVIGGNEEGFFSTYRIGGEIEPIENLFGRLGYRYFSGNYTFQRPDLNQLSGGFEGSGFSGGAGYRFEFGEESLSLDYGAEFLTVAKNGWQHIVSLALQF